MNLQKHRRYFYAWAFLSFSLAACRPPAVDVTGFMEGEDYLVGSVADGSVEEVLVKEGDEVKAGQVLARISSEQVRSGIKNAEALVAVLDSELSRARSVLNRMPKNFPGGGKGGDFYKRVKEVYEAGGVSKAELNRAKSAGSNDTARYTADQAQILVKELESQKQKAQSKLDDLKALLEKTALTAPADGRVIKRFLKQGETVTAGSPAFLITDAKVVYLKTYVPEKDLGKLNWGQKVRVKVDGFQDRWFEGELMQISPTAEPSSKEILTEADRLEKAFLVKIALQNPQGLFKPGMTGQAVLSLGKGGS